MLHSALLWHKLEVKTHKRHLMSWCHGRSIVRVWVKIDRAITEGLGEDWSRYNGTILYTVYLIVKVDETYQNRIRSISGLHYWYHVSEQKYWWLSLQYTIYRYSAFIEQIISFITAPKVKYFTNILLPCGSTAGHHAVDGCKTTVGWDAVGYRCNADQLDMLSHKTVQWLKYDINQRLNS